MTYKPTAWDHAVYEFCALTSPGKTKCGCKSNYTPCRMHPCTLRNDQLQKILAMALGWVPHTRNDLSYGAFLRDRFDSKGWEPAGDDGRSYCTYLEEKTDDPT